MDASAGGGLEDFGDFVEVLILEILDLGAEPALEVRVHSGSLLGMVFWALVLGLQIERNGVIRSVPVHSRVIALTFDACEAGKRAGYDARLIAVLEKEKVRATLFLGGKWMEHHAAAAQSLGASGLFEIGSHSYSHPHFPRLSVSAMRSELAKTNGVALRLTGHTPLLFRPPYGEVDARTVTAARKLGMRTVLWSIVTGDPDQHISARQIVRVVLSRAKPGAIVIMHMNGRGWHSAEALPSVIDGLRKMGYRFATVSEMLAESKR